MMVFELTSCELIYVSYLWLVFDASTAPRNERNTTSAEMIKRTGRQIAIVGFVVRILREIIVRFPVFVQTIVVILESKWLTALWAQPIGIADAFGSGVGAVKEVVVEQLTIRGDWAIAAVLHVEYVDIIEFL